MRLIRSEHTAGLSVEARYLRGPTKAKQAELMGLADKPSFVCLQFRFENRKAGNGGAPIRRLRILQRSSLSSSSSTIIGPNRVVAPPEIAAALAPGQKVECVVGIDFAGISDRDNSLRAALDVKFGTGGVPIEIKPNLGDLLMPCKLLSIEDFDSAVGVLHGFQRVESTVPVPDATTRSELPKKLVRGMALWPVGGGRADWKSDDDGDKLRMLGTLPSSLDPVYVMVTCPPGATAAKITVCCDHALAVNSILNQAKRTLL